MKSIYIAIPWPKARKFIERSHLCYLCTIICIPSSTDLKKATRTTPMLSLHRFCQEETHITPPHERHLCNIVCTIRHAELYHILLTTNMTCTPISLHAKPKIIQSRLTDSRTKNCIWSLVDRDLSPSWIWHHSEFVSLPRWPEVEELPSLLAFWHVADRNANGRSPR